MYYIDLKTHGRYRAKVLKSGRGFIRQIGEMKKHTNETVLILSCISFVNSGHPINIQSASSLYYKPENLNTDWEIYAPRGPGYWSLPQ